METAVQVVETRKFGTLEQYMDRSWNEACKAGRAKYPGIDLKPDGGFMDCVNLVAWITKDQADKHGLDWDSLRRKDIGRCK